MSVFLHGSGGVDTSEVTALPSDVKNDKVYVNSEGDLVQGTMPIITVPTPTITVNNSGLILATESINSGSYVKPGSATRQYQLPTQSGTTITPGTSTKTVVSNGRYTTGNVYVAGDSDLISSNIKSGITIFGVQGNYKEPRYEIKQDFAIDIKSKQIAISLDHALPENTPLSNIISIGFNFKSSDGTRYILSGPISAGTKGLYSDTKGGYGTFSIRYEYSLWSGRDVIGVNFYDFPIYETGSQLVQGSFVIKQ